MPVRNAEAEWKGDLQHGNGEIKLESGAFQGDYSFATRFEDGNGTNPEELIGAAHASCFSMALSADLASNGYEPESVHTSADVHLEKAGDGFEISRIELNCEARVPGLNESAFQKHAEEAKKNCPVSKVLSGTSISLNANLNN